MNPVCCRRHLLGCGLSFAALACAPRSVLGQGASTGRVVPQRRWMDAALAMRALALSWGDQPYGAVLVLNSVVVGEGPSRVVQRNDPTAHAEREAIRDAQRRLGREQLAGSILVSTSRPCADCERAAQAAGVARMVFGELLQQQDVAPLSSGSGLPSR
ncbi:MAG: nucleoside deaminase [Rhodoferax sp.]|nr:nucleoside deaminase [Rhodoferax sp.]